MTRRSNRDLRRGYILLIVIGVLVLLVTALAKLSTLSMRRALAAADARMRLQQRVGAESIERVLLPRAPALFARLEEAAQRHAAAGKSPAVVPHQIRTAVTIGTVTFDVVLADEDAKLNLNRVYHAVGKNRTERTLAALVGPAAGRAIRMLPAVPAMSRAIDRAAAPADEPSEGESGAVPRAFRSWGEVFDLSRLARVSGSDAALPNLSGEITCWGGGALNIRRASDAAMRAAATCILSDAGAGRLVSRYRENPTTPLEILVAREATRETDRRGLRRMLGETSTHFSLWLDASSPARRSMRRFSVMRLTDDGITMNERFSF